MAKAYLQPSLFFDVARVGSLTVYVAGGTTKATLYNPTSGAPISNPVGIDADGYAASFMADTGMAFDLVAKDYLGATRATIPNVMINSNGIDVNYQFTKNYREENIPIGLCLPIARNTFSQPTMFLEKKIVSANFLARSVQFGCESDTVSQLAPIPNAAIYTENANSGDLTKIADITSLSRFPKSKRIINGLIKNGPEGDFLSLKGGDEIWIGYTDSGANPSGVIYAHTTTTTPHVNAKTFATTSTSEAPSSILFSNISGSSSIGWVGISANEYYWSV